MRLIIPISIIVLLLALVLPLALVSGPETEPDADAEESAAPSDEAEQDAQEPEETPFPYTLDTDAAEDGLDSALTLKVLVGETVQEMTMGEYLRGVVAAEMPVTFEAEALKAQAVAARTYTLYRMIEEPADRHPEAYVCDDYTCCKAYKTPGALEEQWGESYAENSAVIAAAVSDTDGLCLTYEGGPILAAFHSSSDGVTEASGAIWGDLPYLQSVRTFESEEEVPNYYTAVELTYDEFKETVLEHVPDAVLEDDNMPYWIGGQVYTESGRLESVEIGGVTVTGVELRSMFSLRSTAITFSYAEDGMTITTSGYGHGVGMSQYGANTLAELGLGFAEILDWYYTDVELEEMSGLFPE